MPMTTSVTIQDAAAAGRARRLERLEASMEVGAAAFLEFGLKTEQPLRDRSAIRGWDQGNYIIVDRPVRKDKLFFRPHEECAVRFLREGTAWGFYTAVMESSPSKYHNLLWLAWPQDASCVMLRRHERVSVQVPCVLHVEDEAVVRATVRDISASGCCISGDSFILHAETRMRATFLLPDGAVIEEIPILVRNQQTGVGAGHRYGCEFLDIPEADRETISFFILKALSAQRGGASTGASLLLLTDNDATVGHLQAVGRAEDLNILTANCVVDMCFQLRAFSPKALLLDVTHAETGIPELCGMVHKTHGIGDMPIVLLGALPWREEQRAIAAGAQASVRDVGALTSLQPLLETIAQPKPDAMRTHAV